MKVLMVDVNVPAGRRFVERETGNRLPACSNCGQYAIAYIGGVCLACRNQRDEKRAIQTVRTMQAPIRNTEVADFRRNVDGAELDAWKRGMDLRALFSDGTVGSIASALGYTVEYVEGNALKGSTSTWTVTGRCLRDSGEIWVLNNLPFAERERVLAHEIAHCLDLDHSLEPWEQERVCDSFAYGVTGTRKP